jgi:hypothetical protein
MRITTLAIIDTKLMNSRYSSGNGMTISVWRHESEDSNCRPPARSDLCASEHMAINGNLRHCRFVIESPDTEETLSPTIGNAVKLVGVRAERFQKLRT